MVSWKFEEPRRRIKAWHNESEIIIVSGFNWIVYNSTSTIGAKGGEQAPRTAIGVDRQGRLMMLEVDGCENVKKAKA